MEEKLRNVDVIHKEVLETKEKASSMKYGLKEYIERGTTCQCGCPEDLFNDYQELCHLIIKTEKLNEEIENGVPLSGRPIKKIREQHQLEEDLEICKATKLELDNKCLYVLFEMHDAVNAGFRKIQESCVSNECTENSIKQTDELIGTFKITMSSFESMVQNDVPNIENRTTFMNYFNTNKCHLEEAEEILKLKKLYYTAMNNFETRKTDFATI